MKFEIQEKLPNLVNGSINKISIETEYKVSEFGSNIDITGQIIVLREIKTTRVTEIKDYFPIDITIPKRLVIKKTGAVTLRIDKFGFDFQEENTLLDFDIQLTNVEETDPPKREDVQFIMEETKYS